MAKRRWLLQIDFGFMRLTTFHRECAMRMSNPTGYLKWIQAK